MIIIRVVVFVIILITVAVSFKVPLCHFAFVQFFPVHGPLNVDVFLSCFTSLPGESLFSSLQVSMEKLAHSSDMAMTKSGIKKCQENSQLL